MIVNRLSNIIDNNITHKEPLLSRDQYAYRKYVGCEDMFMRLKNEISVAKYNKNDLYIISLDIKAAFHNLPHEVIFININK